MHLYEINRVLRMYCCSFVAPSCGVDESVMLGYVTPTVKPPDATVDINYKTQPNAIRDEKGGGGTLRSILEEFLYSRAFG